MTDTLRLVVTILLAGAAITVIAMIWTWTRGLVREAKRDVNIVRPVLAADAVDDDPDGPPFTTKPNPSASTSGLPSPASVHAARPRR